MQITIYSTPTCVYCKKAKEFFNENNVSFIEVNVAASQTVLDDFVQKTGQRGVPVIDMGGDLIVGFDKEAIEEKLSMHPASSKPVEMMSDPMEDNVCDSCQ